MTSRNEPLISVIVPAFNAGATLRESALSALAGSYGKIELIIVDDGSIDSTGEVGKRIAAEDPRARFIRRENGGVSAALNEGLKHASGDYVARLDADDLWHPSKLDRQVAIALRQTDAAFIYTNVRYVDREGRVVRDVAPQIFPPKSLCRGIYESIVGGNSSALMRCDAAVRAGGYDETLTSWEDLLMQLKISAENLVAHVPAYLVGYRVRPGSLSARPENMLTSWRMARRKIEASFPQVPSHVLDWAHGRRCTELAESFAWTGSWPTSVSLLLEALRHDPVRASRFLGYRAARHFRRRFSAQRSEYSAPLFMECNPDENVNLSEYDLGLEGRGLRVLDKGRAEHLRSADQRLT